MDIYKVLSEFMASHATDLHIVDGAPPLMRIDGKIIFTNYQALSAQESQSLIYAMLTDKQKSVFESKNELDLGFGVKGVGRIRANIYRQRGAVCASLRKIPNKFFTFEELGLPSIALEVMKIPVGLVLVTGATGSGKTTTLASMINYLNENRSSHIITIEDPIEYVHEHKKSIISQREIGSDSETFSSALKYVLRQDPDTILIGEMRDLETVQAAITVAETGHLVFATLHTPDAIQSINRIVDVFPPHQQPQIRNQLSFVLQAIFSQELVPKLDGGLSLVCETLMITPAIRNLIREEKVEQIATAMQTGGKYGMQTRNQSLFQLYKRKSMTYTQALSLSYDVEDIKRLIGKV